MTRLIVFFRTRQSRFLIVKLVTLLLNANRFKGFLCWKTKIYGNP